MKVFIDGKAGTTGLRIESRLLGRSDVELLTLPETERKDPERRRWALNHCDAAILCLPDQAAVQAADMVENDHVILLDASTAHRTQPGWDYGFPELSPAHRRAIASSHRIAVPGCHASGFIALVHPLVQAGILPRDALLSCFSVTGYSGGGKTMIAQYEDDELDLPLQSPRQYGLGQKHKHLPEMQKITGLETAPMFSPIVSNFPCGLVVTVPVFRQQLAAGAGAADIRTAYQAAYQGPVVQYVDTLPEDGFFPSNSLDGRDCMEISVGGNEDRILLIASYDNLGKGASGAALQCLNIAAGIDETAGLVL
mgnify:CR=1 FL=1